MQADILNVEQLNSLWETVSPRLEAGANSMVAPSRYDKPSNMGMPNTVLTQNGNNLQSLSNAVEQEWLALLTYETLNRRLGRRERRLSILYERQMCLLKKMAGAFFILTGQRICRPIAQAECVSDNIELLRERYLWESAQTNIYRHHFQANRFPDIFFDATKQKEENADILRTIIENLVV